MLGISKRDDPYLRTLLIHGARAVLITQSRADRAMDPWLKAVLARRPKNVAIVALANKMARWLARAGSTFREATRQPQPGAPPSAFWWDGGVDCGIGKMGKWRLTRGGERLRMSVEGRGKL